MRRARYAVAKANEIPADLGVVVPLGTDGECALFRHGETWHATGSLCPHQNAPLDGAPMEAGVIVCQRHGYRFCPKTGDCLTVGGYGIPVYRVDLEGDTVFVSVWEYD